MEDAISVYALKVVTCVLLLDIQAITAAVDAYCAGWFTPRQLMSPASSTLTVTAR